MLPAAHRLRRSSEFTRAVRLGNRFGKSTVVVHFLEEPNSSLPTTVGFVVSKAVGNAVVRNSVKRRLRAIMYPLLDAYPVGGVFVVRALPASSNASFAMLSQDLNKVFARAISQATKLSSGIAAGHAHGASR